jgi:hypothetical protein
MAKPPGTRLKWMRAAVFTLAGVEPAHASAFDSAFEYQPTYAAPHAEQKQELTLTGAQCDDSNSSPHF